MLDAYLKARYDKQSVATNAAYHTLFSLSVLAANTYVWPSPKLDTLESLRFNKDGHNSADVENWYYVSKLGELTDQPRGCTSVTDPWPQVPELAFAIQDNVVYSEKLCSISQVLPFPEQIHIGLMCSIGPQQIQPD
ncbi:hypothetical protein B0H14DRAFT_2630699 [Mycena olivaceomarginata]|nr:hypothetical protein B0H14DRAFT_2630699 [Mycena olivaceomarginata]